MSASRRKRRVFVRLGLDGSVHVVLTKALCHQAVHWAIDELKATVPIWKKEMFVDGGVWKENAESRALLLRAGVNRSRLPQVRLSWIGMGAALLLPMLSSLAKSRG